ncbi:MAG: hypothetical protein KKA19_04235, partial [Candidatus Margulisbacteria bacterium]|nr:hypothetical protein [Candidatus Margulisiibacteriota bacterium]
MVIEKTGPGMYKDFESLSKGIKKISGDQYHETYQKEVTSKGLDHADLSKVRFEHKTDSAWSRFWGNNVLEGQDLIDEIIKRAFPDIDVGEATGGASDWGDTKLGEIPQEKFVAILKDIATEFAAKGDLVVKFGDNVAFEMKCTDLSKKPLAKETLKQKPVADIRPPEIKQLSEKEQQNKIIEDTFSKYFNKNNLASIRNASFGYYDLANYENQLKTQEDWNNYREWGVKLGETMKTVIDELNSKGISTIDALEHMASIKEVNSAYKPELDFIKRYYQNNLTVSGQLKAPFKSLFHTIANG